MLQKVFLCAFFETVSENIITILLFWKPVRWLIHKSGHVCIKIAIRIDLTHYTTF